MSVKNANSATTTTNIPRPRRKFTFFTLFTSSQSTRLHPLPKFLLRRTHPTPNLAFDANLSLHKPLRRAMPAGHSFFTCL